LPFYAGKTAPPSAEWNTAYPPGSWYGPQPYQTRVPTIGEEFTICHHERVVHPFKAPVIAPGSKPAVNRLPWRQVFRQQAPRAARPHDIEDAVQDLAHRPLARPARRAGLRQVRRDHAPLRIGQIGLVSLDGAAMLSSSSWRPHGESKLVQELPWNHGGRRCVNLFRNSTDKGGKD